MKTHRPTQIDVVPLLLGLEASVPFPFLNLVEHVLEHDALVIKVSVQLINAHVGSTCNDREHLLRVEGSPQKPMALSCALLQQGSVDARDVGFLEKGAVRGR